MTKPLSLRRLFPELALLLEGIDYTLEQRQKHILIRVEGVVIQTIPHHRRDAGKQSLNAIACVRRQLRQRGLR